LLIDELKVRLANKGASRTARARSRRPRATRRAAPPPRSRLTGREVMT